MTEPTQPPEAPQPPDPTGLRINWHRVRVYLLSILLMLTMWFCATVLTIRLHPQRVVDELLAQLPFSSSTGKVHWLNRRTLEIDDLKFEGFFYADTIIVTASPVGLWRHRVAKVQVMGGQLFTKPLYEMMDRTGAGNSDGLGWVIGRLEITRGMVWLNNLVGDTSVQVNLGERHTIILSGLRLGKPDASPEMTQERTVEIVNVNIPSTEDPLVPVFSFPLTRVRYTYTEIWHHHIREIDLIRPTMHLGEDLFWLTKDFKSEHKPTSNPGLGAPWEVGHFEVQYGQLAVNVFGQPVFHFPFFFDTKVNDVRLDELDKISAKATIPIESLTQDYPDYKVRIVNLHGNLYLSPYFPDKDGCRVRNLYHRNR